MGRDIIWAGVWGVLAVVALVAVVEVLEDSYQWLRARRYEQDYARHVARQTIAAQDGYGSVGSMSLEDEIAYYQSLAAPVWQSDLERADVPLPAWADPAAARDTSRGAGAGSGPDLDAPPPPPLNLPPGWTQPELPYPDPDPEDTALDETWDRLMAAWSQQDVRGDGDTHPPSQDRSSGQGGEDKGHTGTATRALGCLVAGVRYWVHPGRWWVAFAGCAPVDDTAARPGWEPTELGTPFDAELAADVARWLREQDTATADYLATLWEDQ